MNAVSHSGELGMRKNSFSNLFKESERAKKDGVVPKVKMDEFTLDVDFKNGLPMLILDLISAFTGYTTHQILQEKPVTERIIMRLNPEDEHF